MTKGSFHCRVCQYDFRKRAASWSPEQIPASIADRLLKLQELHLTLLRLSEKVESQNLPRYFTLFGSLLSLLIGDGFPNRQVSSLRRLLTERLHLAPSKDWHLDEPHENQFDFLSLDERVRYLMMTSILVDPWPDHLASLQQHFSEVAGRVKSTGLQFPFWRLGPSNYYLSKPKETYLLGSSLAHRFLQYILTVSPKVDLHKYEHLRCTNEVEPLLLNEDESRHQRFQECLTPGEDPYLLLVFEYELERWVRALQRLARDPHFNVRL